jgi:hypothetical protein
MNQYSLPALARQHHEELHNVAGGSQRQRGDREARPSLRVRTGWTMVDLGLRLIAQPGATQQPRPARS